MSSRILGMGDVLGLIEEVEQKVDHEKAEKLARKLQKGTNFDLQDFRDQLSQMQDMGGLGNLAEKIPGMSQLPEQAAKQLDDKQLVKLTAIIDSMTKQDAPSRPSSRHRENDELPQGPVRRCKMSIVC